MASPFEEEEKKKKPTSKEGLFGTQQEQRLKGQELLAKQLELQRSAPGLFREKAEAIEGAVAPTLATAEAAMSGAAYGGKRAGPGAGGTILETGAKELVRINEEVRAAAAARKFDALEKAQELEEAAVVSEREAMRELEEEDVEEVINAQALAGKQIAKFLPDEDEWALYQSAWQESKALHSPAAFEAYWTDIQATYGPGGWGGDHASPMAHPLVQINILNGRPPLEGVTPWDTTEEGMEAGRREYQQELAQMLNPDEVVGEDGNIVHTAEV